jgi:hypothetical protein
MDSPWKKGKIETHLTSSIDDLTIVRRPVKNNLLVMNRFDRWIIRIGKGIRFNVLSGKR